MYTYNYLHIWRAARNVKNPPANNYACKSLRGAMMLRYDILKGI